MASPFKNNATEINGNLFDYLNVANGSVLDSLELLKEQLGYLNELDQLYVDLVAQAQAIKPVTSAVLTLNAHANLRAAIWQTLGGHLLPVYMTLRGSIESALYANAMVVDPSLADVWINRDNDAESREKCKRSFTVKRIFDALENAHSKEFRSSVYEVYETVIDFGAHPNSGSLLRSLQIKELDDGRHLVRFGYMYGADSAQLRQALVACVEIGLIVFFIALICSHDHQRKEELNKRALDTQSKAEGFIQSLGFQTIQNQFI